jgi:hypothetical protein
MKDPHFACFLHSKDENLRSLRSLRTIFCLNKVVVLRGDGCNRPSPLCTSGCFTGKKRGDCCKFGDGRKRKEYSQADQVSGNEQRTHIIG